MQQEAMNLSKVLVENRKTGQEGIFDGQGRTVSTIYEYWQWAYSSLLGNTERGNFAEYLVAVALGVSDKIRNDWASVESRSFL